MGEYEYLVLSLPTPEPCIHPGVFANSNGPDTYVHCFTCNTDVRNADL